MENCLAGCRNSKHPELLKPRGHHPRCPNFVPEERASVVFEATGFPPKRAEVLLSDAVFAAAQRSFGGHCFSQGWTVHFGDHEIREGQSFKDVNAADDACFQITGLIVCISVVICYPKSSVTTSKQRRVDETIDSLLRIVHPEDKIIFAGNPVDIRKTFEEIGAQDGSVFEYSPYVRPTIKAPMPGAVLVVSCAGDALVNGCYSADFIKMTDKDVARVEIVHKYQDCGGQGEHDNWVITWSLPSGETGISYASEDTRCHSSEPPAGPWSLANAQNTIRGGVEVDGLTGPTIDFCSV